MENFLTASSSPHIRSSVNTSGIMRDVVIALMPALAAGIYFFGIRALVVTLVSVASCVLSEYLYNRICKRKQSIGDYSAAVTGMLLAFNLTPSISPVIAAVGGAFAIIIAKMLFGGLGHNFINPALAARAFLLASWPVQMTSWVYPADAVSSATPLAMIKKGGEVISGALPSYWSLLLGNVGGCIGETSALALLIGVIYLLYRRVITLHIPLSFIATVGIFTWILGGNSLFTGDFTYHILSGGLLLGAFFMATDYTTSPVTRKGMIIMGVGCGLITSVIRLYGGYPEGVSYSILFMNVATPLIDKYTKPKSFGGEKACVKC